MIKPKKMHLIISLTIAIYLLLTVSSTIWAGQNNRFEPFAGAD